MIKIKVEWNADQTRRIAMGDDGKDYSKTIHYAIKKKACAEGKEIEYYPDKNEVWYEGKYVPRGLEGVKSKKKVKAQPKKKEVEIDARLPEEKLKELKYLHNESYADKPELLIMSELKWKYLVRSCMRGKNIIMTGPSGCGKCVSGDTKINIKVDDILYQKIIELRT